MAKKPLKQLPFVQLTPTTRGQGSFTCVDATSDTDAMDSVVMTFYCHGMDVRIDLTHEQATLALERLHAAIDDIR